MLVQIESDWHCFLKQCPSVCPFWSHSCRSVFFLFSPPVDSLRLRTKSHLSIKTWKQSLPFLVYFSPRNSSSLAGRLMHTLTCSVYRCHCLPLPLCLLFAPSNTSVSSCELASLWFPGGFAAIAPCALIRCTMCFYKEWQDTEHWGQNTIHFTFLCVCIIHIWSHFLLRYKHTLLTSY